MHSGEKGNDTINVMAMSHDPQQDTHRATKVLPPRPPTRRPDAKPLGKLPANR